MSKSWKRAITLALAIVALALITASNVGAELKLFATPPEGTSNSLYTFIAKWKDDAWPIPTPVPERPVDPADPSNPPGMVLLAGLPMYFVGDNGGYRCYVACVSAGLNMSNPIQYPMNYLPNLSDPLTNADYLDVSRWFPDASLNNLIWTPYWGLTATDVLRVPVWPMGLDAFSNGAPATITVTARAWGDPAAPVVEASASVTVHDSRPNWQIGSDGNYYNEMIDYGGNNGDRDWLSAGDGDIDPLTVEPNNDGSGVSGDDGSSSHDFVFRVRYRNRDGIPPIPWWHSINYSQADYGEVSDWGVALYLDVWGIGDYRLIPMMPEAGGRTADGHHSLTWSDPGQVFIARIMPNDGMANPLLFEYDKTYFPAWTCWAYNSLPVGTFNYFYACSDDWLRFTEHAELDYGLDFVDHDSGTQFPREAPFVFEYQPNLEEWGLQPPDTQFQWTVPPTYTNYNGLRMLNSSGLYSRGVFDGVRDVVEWTRVPSDATDDLWGTTPWGRSDRGLTYSSAPDFTTIGFRANNNPLDPTRARQVTGFRPSDTDDHIDRDAHRKFSVDGRYAFDSTIYVDRPVLVPGKFMKSSLHSDQVKSTYQYPSTEHPIVGGQLTVPLYDDNLISLRDEVKYGGGRYYGTLLFGNGTRTFKRALNPQMTGTFLPGTSSRTFDARRAETAGATTSTQCTYRIMYKSRDGAGPLYVRVLIGNTGSRGNKATEEYPDLDSDGYPGVTMSPDPAQSTPLNYKTGVWYIATRQIATPGPYNYVFEASDGSQKIVWPRRPDYYTYSGMPWDDWWVPTASTSDQYLINDPNNPGQKIRNPNYDSNDFVPGPFINSAPQLIVASDSVSPSSGKQGQNFKFRVFYKDADGQRPYTTNLVIETNSKGNTRTCQMLPESVLDPNQDNSARYKAGVYYYFNTASVQDLVLEKGTRRYKFEFFDDWGRQVELNDRIEGEKVSSGWIQNWTIKGNSVPTLYDGSVEAGDGTSNSATMWTFRATYGDLDNEAPTVKKVFIGLLQPDEKTILWDGGHDMTQSYATDNTYNDGVEFSYQTRLPGIQNGGESPKQYYYAFLFQDGYAWATYKSSSNSELRSNAASCISGEALTSLGGGLYQFNPVIVQQATPDADDSYKVAPDDPNDIVSLMGVYLSEDLTGTNYYAGTDTEFEPGDSTVYLGSPLTTKPDKVWLKYQAQSPIVGPLPVGTPVPPGLIPDAQVYDGTDLKLVDDMKSGWQRPDDSPADVRYSVMQGVGMDSTASPSAEYVTPEDPSLIASIEGIYDTAEMDGVNYYDPTSQTATYEDTTLDSDEPTMVGTVDDRVPDATDSSIIHAVVKPESPDLIRMVLAVTSEDGSVTYTPGDIDTRGTITLAENLPLGTKVSITYTRTMYNTGDSIVWLTDHLPTAGQTVYIKYSDIRFTHTTTGQAQDNSTGVWAVGIKYFSPDGWQISNVHTKGNAADPTSGVLGVWASDTLNGRSYFDPWRVTHADDELHLPLTYQVPSGTNDLWARYYQKGDYQIDRWNRIVQFLSAPTGSVASTYLFGSRMPRTININTPPTLDLVDLRYGGLSKPTGTSVNQFTYTVRYTDIDGPNGQAPTYVRVYIDGVAHPMAQSAQGTPAYREGAVFTYTTTLGPKGHKYRFEASDGADVAIYDYYTHNNLDRPESGDENTYVDLDGPWVNDAPTLSNGACDPSAQAGSISVIDSVTFTVTYTDSDGDAPYPLGTDSTGVPMLWVDCGGDTDTYFEGKVKALGPDPLDTSKKRVIVATKLDGSAPGWTSNLAGKLMQITNGASSDRVYLIQSNTADSLTIAVDDLGPAGENLAVGSAFRINALRTRKVDIAAQDFTVGVGYTITVPRLAVGDHKFKFSARSKLNKPTWLIAQETASAGESLPYSEKVTFPTSSELTGPTVTSTPPAGNAPPVLINTAATAVYDGPKVNSALVLSSSLIKLDTGDFGSWTEEGVGAVRQILGVYRNANADPEDDAVQNYFSSFDQENGEISLSPELGALPAELVQFGRVENSLLAVKPDSINAIQTVIGIYDNADLTGTDYYENAPAMAEGDTVLKLGTPLPSGTKRAYIKYAPVDDELKPPVYVRYFDKHAADTIFHAGEPLTLRVNYSDADLDPPAYHHGVTGSLKAIIGSTSGNMLPLNPPVTDYSVETPFTVTMSNVPEGNVKLYFEGSDGYTGHTVNFPTTPYDIVVNYRPSLSNAIVDPTTGPQATLFNFTVTFKDLGYQFSTPKVYVRLIREAEQPDEYADEIQDEYLIEMSTALASPVYANGVVYTADTTGLQLAYGEYDVIFEASDGYQDALPLAYGSLVVRENNTPPQVSNLSVTPAAGKLSQTFVYSAKYSDAEGDPPVVGSGKGLTLVIDPGTSSEKRLTMTGQSATKAEYIAGVSYNASVTGSTLGMGEHTYTVEATDGTDSAPVPTAKVGPVLLVPVFSNLRVVSASAADPDAASAVSSAALGENVLIVGRMKFPRNTATGKPTDIDNVTIDVTKPDGTTVFLTGTVTMLSDAENTDQNYWVGKLSVSSYPMGADPALVTGTNLTLSASGEWKLSAVWGGDAKWDKVQTDENSDGLNDGFSLSVGGPMRTVAVKDPSRPNDVVSNTPIVDMITPPMVIGSGDPGAIFRGYDRARQMQVVRWDPQTGAYYKYGLQPSFPELLPGDAVWIKPKSDYPDESIKLADAVSGLLALGNPDMTLDFTREYRLIKVFSKSYTTRVNSTTGDTEPAPCVIPLTSGWNQFGNIFFNWKKDAIGQVITPRADMGIPISELRVRYLNQTLSIADAMAAGWIRDYAWRWDAEDYKYVPVHAIATAENFGGVQPERVLKAWSGFWIRAFVNCDLIIDPNTSYNGVAATTAVSSLGSADSSSLASFDQLDMPPPMPQ